MPFSKDYVKICMRLRFMPGTPIMYAERAKIWERCHYEFGMFKPSDQIKQNIASKCILPKNQELILSGTMPYGFGNTNAYIKLKSNRSSFDNDIVFDDIHKSVSFENLMDLTNAFTLTSREMTDCQYVTGEITLQDTRLK